VKNYTGAEIKAIRERQEMSPEVFARNYGLSPSDLQNMESDKFQPLQYENILFFLIDKHPEIVLEAVKFVREAVT